MPRPSEKSLALARLLFSRTRTIEGLAHVLDDLENNRPIVDIDSLVFDAVKAGAWCPPLIHRQIEKLAPEGAIAEALERLRHAGRVFYGERVGGARGWDITRRGLVDADTKR